LSSLRDESYLFGEDEEEFAHLLSLAVVLWAKGSGSCCFHFLYDLNEMQAEHSQSKGGTRREKN
jgi:hypothetical protein